MNKLIGISNELGDVLAFWEPIEVSLGIKYDMPHHHKMMMAASVQYYGPLVESGDPEAWESLRALGNGILPFLYQRALHNQDIWDSLVQDMLRGQAH